MRKLSSRRARAMAKLRKTHAGGRSGGNKLGSIRKPHCPCGAMTKDRAKQRNHVCSRP